MENSERLKADLTEQLHALNRSIRQRQEVLAQIHEIQTRYSRHADMGWLISVVAEGPGTFLAVTSGQKVRKWDEMARKVEKELLGLELDKKLAEHELRFVGGKMTPYFFKNWQN